MKVFDRSGQAVVEYLVIFSIMALIAVGLVKSLNEYMGSTVGSLGYHLSKELTVGVCADEDDRYERAFRRTCFFKGYRNWK